MSLASSQIDAYRRDGHLTVPDVFDKRVVDEVVTVSNDEAFEMSRKVARSEGIPGGISTGGNVAAAPKVAARDDMAGKTIVTIACSFAERYLSTPLFDEPAT